MSYYKAKLNLFIASIFYYLLNVSLFIFLVSLILEIIDVKLNVVDTVLIISLVSFLIFLFAYFLFLHKSNKFFIYVLKEEHHVVEDEDMKTIQKQFKLFDEKDYEEVHSYFNMNVIYENNVLNNLSYKHYYVMFGKSFLPLDIILFILLLLAAFVSGGFDGPSSKLFFSYFKGDYYLFKIEPDLKFNAVIARDTLEPLKMNELKPVRIGGYLIYTDNEHKLKQFINDEFIHKLNILEERLNTTILFGIIDQEIHIAIENKMSILKPLSKKNIDERLKHDIQIKEELIRLLNSLSI